MCPSVSAGQPRFNANILLICVSARRPPPKYKPHHIICVCRLKLRGSVYLERPDMWVCDSLLTSVYHRRVCSGPLYSHTHKGNDTLPFGFSDAQHVPDLVHDARGRSSSPVGRVRHWKATAVNPLLKVLMSWSQVAIRHSERLPTSGRWISFKMSRSEANRHP